MGFRKALRIKKKDMNLPLTQHGIFFPAKCHLTKYSSIISFYEAASPCSCKMITSNCAWSIKEIFTGSVILSMWDTSILKVNVK